MFRNIAAAAALAACVLSPGAALAMPFDAGPLVRAAERDNPVEQARIFCFNRFTGGFLHWGPCGRPVVYYRPRPRVYCRNLFTGRFLHWGYC